MSYLFCLDHSSDLPDHCYRARHPDCGHHNLRMKHYTPGPGHTGERFLHQRPAGRAFDHYIHDISCHFLTKGDSV